MVAEPVMGASASRSAPRLERVPAPGDFMLIKVAYERRLSMDRRADAAAGRRGYRRHGRRSRTGDSGQVAPERQAGTTDRRSRTRARGGHRPGRRRRCSSPSPDLDRRSPARVHRGSSRSSTAKPVHPATTELQIDRSCGVVGVVRNCGAVEVMGPGSCGHHARWRTRRAGRQRHRVRPRARGTQACMVERTVFEHSKDDDVLDLLEILDLGFVAHRGHSLVPTRRVLAGSNCLRDDASNADRGK